MDLSQRNSSNVALVSLAEASHDLLSTQANSSSSSSSFSFQARNRFGRPSREQNSLEEAGNPENMENIQSSLPSAFSTSQAKKRVGRPTGSQTTIWTWEMDKDLMQHILDHNGRLETQSALDFIRKLHSRHEAASLPQNNVGADKVICHWKKLKDQLVADIQYRAISYKDACEPRHKAVLRYVTRPETDPDKMRRLWESKEEEKRAEWVEWRTKIMEITIPDELVNSSQLPTVEEAEDNIRSALDRRREENRARSRLLADDAQAATQERRERSELCRKMAKSIETFSEEIHRFMDDQNEK